MSDGVAGVEVRSERSSYRDKYMPKVLDSLFDAVLYADGDKVIQDFNNAAMGLWEINKADISMISVEELFYRGDELGYVLNSLTRAFRIFSSSSTNRIECLTLCPSEN